MGRVLVLTAALLEWAEPAGARVIAVDPTPQEELLALAREREQLRLEQATIPLLEELIDHAVVVYEAAPASAALWRSRVLAQLELDGPWYHRMRDAWLARVAERGLLRGQ